ncbi:MAG: LamG domain-containing protein [Pseudomonadota bacterium]
MNNATGTVTAQIHRARRALRAVALAGLTGALLSACGGGAETTDNPITSVTPPATYVGPPPATADVQSFKLNVWDNVQMSSRCGGCHNDQVGQLPMFARHDDVNLAYEAANGVVDLGQPSNSRLVSKVSGGHNCWLSDAAACGDIMTTWISNWVGAASGAGREIVLEAPQIIDPGSSRSVSNITEADFANLLYNPILTTYCDGCHTSSAPTAQSPFFAEGDVSTALDSAKSKIDLDDPAASRFVVRMRSEFHNCWNNDCATAANQMEAAITALAQTVDPTEVDPALVTSKALRITDGTVASGGNRYEASQIALWEFKTGSGSTAFDTSGVEPAIDLTFSGDVEWFGGWGVTINDGKLQGSTAASAKLHDMILATGEYSIEAWVVPANVTQEMARIVSYSAGEEARNFTLQQTLYNYDFRHRSTETNLNGDPQLSTPDADEVLQATLQHVVVTSSPVDGRAIYVNGVMVSGADPVPAGSMADWEDTFALVLGNEVSSDALWQGTLRMVSIHNRVLSTEQIVQNFDVGVGEKFFLLFSISDVIAVPDSYILFEVAQFDTNSYLFTQPHFVTLGATTPQVTGVAIEGLRVGINGAEAPVGQAFGKMVGTLESAQFGPLGQPLSQLGAVLPLEKGPADDEFFLTFDRLGTETFVRIGDPPLVITEADLPAAQRIGVRTFDEINASMAAVTGVDPETPAVDMTFQSLRQSLPTVANPQGFLSSHQVAIAQLAIEYCNALVDGPGAGAYFNNFNFNLAPATAYSGAARNQVIDPLLDNIMGLGIATQPDRLDVMDELGYFTTDGVRPNNLIDRLIASPDNPNSASIAKGVCAAVLGSGVMLVQ